MPSAEQKKRRRVGWKVGLAMGIASMVHMVAAAEVRAQSDAPSGGEASRGPSVVLEISLLGEDARPYAIGATVDGPPAGEPEFIDVGGFSIGVSVGVLDREQQVVEVHLFRAAGEPMAQLLIEPGVLGYADVDESTSIEVELQAIRDPSG